jgi:hypothetical protein
LPEPARIRDSERAVGVAETELLYAAAELRSAAGRGDLDSRALLYNLADGLEKAADRLQPDNRVPGPDPDGGPGSASGNGPGNDPGNDPGEVGQKSCPES